MTRCGREAQCGEMPKTNWTKATHHAHPRYWSIGWAETAYTFFAFVAEPTRFAEALALRMREIRDHFAFAVSAAVRVHHAFVCTKSTFPVNSSLHHDAAIQLKLKFHLARHVTSRHDSTRSRCRAHAFWLCRACRTARLDTLDTTSSTGKTRRTCRVVSRRDVTSQVEFGLTTCSQVLRFIQKRGRVSDRGAAQRQTSWSY